MGCCHPNLVRCSTHFTVTVRVHPRRRFSALLPSRPARYAREEDLARSPERPHEQAAPAGQPSTSAGGAARAAAHGSGEPGGWGSVGSGPSTSGSGYSSGGSTAEGFVTLLIMECCSLGSLHRAIRAGRFCADRRSGRPNLVSPQAQRGAWLAHRGMARLVLLFGCHRQPSSRHFRLAPPHVLQDWVCRTARDIARGLAHLHGELGLVHRDM